MCQRYLLLFWNQVRAVVMTMCFREVAASHIILLICSVIYFPHIHVPLTVIIQGQIT